MEDEEYPKIDPLAKAHLTKDAEKIKTPHGRCPSCRQRLRK